MTKVYEFESTFNRQKRKKKLSVDQQVKNLRPPTRLSMTFYIQGFKKNISQLFIQTQTTNNQEQNNQETDMEQTYIVIKEIATYNRIVWENNPVMLSIKPNFHKVQPAPRN